MSWRESAEKHKKKALVSTGLVDLGSNVWHGAPAFTSAEHLGIVQAGCKFINKVSHYQTAQYFMKMLVKK